MCRNITTLRGLQPAVTAEEIEAAARQYVRKVTGVQKTTDATAEAFERAVAAIAAATTEVIAALPPRRTPPPTLPPLRRLGLITVGPGPGTVGAPATSRRPSSGRSTGRA